MKSTCKICHKEFTYYKSNSSGIYCSFKCYNKDRQNISFCPSCQKTFIKTKKEQIYCSAKCFGIAHKGENNPAYKDKCRVKKCIVCHKDIVKSPKASFKLFDNNKYCSNKCYRSNLSGINNPMYGKSSYNKGVFTKRLQSICKSCGKTFHYHKSVSKGLFCSPKCFGEGNRGYANVNYIGAGKYNRGSNWNNIRKDIRARDKYVCMKCGMSNEECLLEFGCELHIHHIVPYRLTKDNSSNNLISLCPVCHIEADWLIRKKNK
jgi:hypothetical protein